MVLLPLLGPAAPAGAAAEEFSLDMTSGELLIRGSTEPAAIGLPTTISGTNTDGQLTDLEFTTPTISFEYEVTSPVTTTVFIDADFSMVGLGSGSINEDGDVIVEIDITVDLHLVIPILAFPQDCQATPVRLTLVSTAPYDGESVTLAAPNFSVPDVPTTPDCTGIISGAVNDALSGAGHSLSMTLAGDLSLPLPGEATVTNLEVSPEGGARVGQEVTLSAAVEPAEEPDEPVDLPGSVTFFDGATNLGTATLSADGTASVTTTVLVAGERSLRAVYSGAPPDWRPSSSPVTPYTLAAAPLLSTDLAGGILIDSDKDFTVSVRNTGLGATLGNARLDVRMFRSAVSGPLSAVTLAHVVDGDPVPVTLSGNGGNSGVPRTGSIEGPAWTVPPGEERTETLRLTVPAGVVPGPVRVVFDLVTVEEGEDVVLSSATGDVGLTPEERFPTELTVGTFPPVTPKVRQGTIVEVGGAFGHGPGTGLVVGPRQGSLFPRGTYSFSIGGRPALARRANDASLVAWAPTLPVVAANGLAYHVVVPADMAVGQHLLQVRYSGDDVYAASVASWPVTIEPGLGEVYDCIYEGLVRGRMVGNVQALAQVPTVGARGDALAVERVEARMFMSRTFDHSTFLGTGFFPEPTGVFDFGLTGGGTGAFTTVSQSGTFPMFSPAEDVDWAVTLTGGAGSLPVGHDAGTTLEVGLESIVFDANSALFTFKMSCLPFDESALWVASVTSTGTSLTVNPAGTARQGDEVELIAEALPVSPGTVEFLDGVTTVGVAPVDGDGIARVAVDDLPPGTRSLTARYFGTVFPDSTSDAVELVVEGIDCFGLAEPGSEAVVRLIYLTVLNRCPDQAGFDYWTDRIDSGATRESVANAIANSHEARKVLVDEAYELMLERRADAGGREFWATRLGQTGSYRDLIGQLGSSAEFRTLAGGTDADVVDRLYERLLHRSPSAADNAFWVDRIETQGIRATVMRMFDLDEPLRTLVGDTYGKIIDRAPTAPERDAGVTLMRDRSDRAALNASVINTNDFYTRAQGFPNVPG